MNEYPGFKEPVTLERNTADGCVWVTIGDATRECVPPERAREIANGLEHINLIGANSPVLDGPDEETERLIDDLRAAAADVENPDGETDE